MPTFLKILARDRVASAAVEYAVCLGLILATVLAAGFFLGTPLQDAFSNAGAGLQSLSEGQSGQHIASAPGTMASAAATPRPGRGLSFWLPISMAATAPFLAAWWLRRRRASKSAPREVPDPVPIPKELQAKFVAKRQTILKFLSADTQQLVNGHMTVTHIMSKTPLTRFAEDEVDEIRMLMKENIIRHLLVCSPTGTLLGIISDRDVNARPGNHAGDIMTANPITVSPDTPVGTVITIMLTKRISCVPVVDDDRLCGIVTTSDLLMALQCVMRLIEQLALPLDLHPNDPQSPADEATADLVECP